jgi:multiple sugar transport system permease protein
VLPAISPAHPPRPRRRPLSGGGGGWTGYLFASPWFLGFFGLTLFPIVASLALSLVGWNGVNLTFTPPPVIQSGAEDNYIHYVGLENYRGVLHDDLARIALFNTAYYSFLAVPLGLCVSLMLALLLNQKLRGIAAFRTIYYMPHIIGGVATIMMWMWVFQPDYGLLNLLLRGGAGLFHWTGLIPAGWQPPTWLNDSRWSKPALIIMSLWGTGGGMLIFLAALQNVPDHLYEAARIDGAGRLRQFWHVTVPQITPAIFFNLVMGVIGSFQVFNEAFVLTGGEGGPDNSTLFYVLYLYRKAFQDFRMGYASALAWVLFVIILGFTLIILRSSRVWVYYEGER